MRSIGMKVLIRGGGDLASGVAARLFRCGFQTLICELPRPKAVRRWVSFSQAILDDEIQVEDIFAKKVTTFAQAQAVWQHLGLPVLVDPALTVLPEFQPDILIDARMMKRAPERGLNDARLFIGLGPGFVAGENCHAVIETMRGPRLGRVFWSGAATPDTGIPERVGAYTLERVVKSPQAGVFIPLVLIGDQVRRGEVIGQVDERLIYSQVDGVVRGILPENMTIQAGEKLGDIDPRNDPSLCRLISDKALAVGGGALEAILSWSHRQGNS